MVRDKDVAGVFPSGNRGQLQAGYLLDGQVFKTVRGDVDFPIEERALYLFGKDALRAQIRDRGGAVNVAARYDLNNFDVDAEFSQGVARPVRLPQGQRAWTRA